MRKTNLHKLIACIQAQKAVCKLVVFFALIVVVLLVIFFNNDEFKLSSARNIVLKDDGFKPQRLVIKVGDSVNFSTTRSESFWPASDAHPQHDMYPDFDPRKPISPDDTWSFTFTKASIRPSEVWT